MGEQRYKAVMAVLSWLATSERAVEGMSDRSHRPTRCPHQMPALVEVRVLEMQRHAVLGSASP